MAFCRAIRSQSAYERSNSLGSQQKEKTNANSLLDPVVVDDDGDADTWRSSLSASATKLTTPADETSRPCPLWNMESGRRARAGPPTGRPARN